MTPLDSQRDDEFAEQVKRAAALPDAPTPLIKAALDLWPARHKTRLAEVAQSALRLVTAVLSFDSWARPATALGMRAGASDTRHLLFSAQGRDIDLRISPAAEHFTLSGQILGPDEAGAIELAAQADGGVAGAQAQVAALDSLGEFRLDGVRTGTYRLTLRVGADRIVLPPIEVGARP